MNVSEFRTAYRRGKYSWPGGYPVFAVTADGGCLCFDCLKSERREILEAIAHGLSHSGWKVEAFEANWEDPELYCSHCNNRIESAYAEPE